MNNYNKKLIKKETRESKTEQKASLIYNDTAILVEDINYSNLNVVQPNEAISGDFSLLCQNSGENKQIKIQELSKVINTNITINPDEINKIYVDGDYTKAFFTEKDFTIDLQRDKVYGEILATTASQTDAKITQYNREIAPITTYNTMTNVLGKVDPQTSDIVITPRPDIGSFDFNYNGEPYALVAEDMYPILDVNASDVSYSLINADSQLKTTLKQDVINNYIDTRNKATINSLLTQAMLDCLQSGDIKVTKITDTTFKLTFSTPIDANYINSLINQNKWYSTNIVNDKIDFDLAKTLGLANSYTDKSISDFYDNVFSEHGEFPDIFTLFARSSDYDYPSISIRSVEQQSGDRVLNFDVSKEFINAWDEKLNLRVAKTELKDDVFNITKSNSFTISTDASHLYIEYDYNKFKTICNNALNDIITKTGDVIVKKQSDDTSVLAISDDVALNANNLIKFLPSTEQYQVAEIDNKVQLQIQFPTPATVTAKTIINLSNPKDDLTDVIIEASSNPDLYRARIPDSTLTKRVQPMINLSASVAHVKKNWIIQNVLGTQTFNLVVPTNAYRCNFEIDIIGQTPSSFINNNFWTFNPNPLLGNKIIFQIIVDASQIGNTEPNVPRWVTLSFNMPRIDGYVVLTNDGNNWDGKMPVDPKFFQIGYALSVKLPSGQTVVASTSGTSFIPLSNVTLPAPKLQLAYSLPLNFTELKFIDTLSRGINISNIEPRTFNNPIIIDCLNAEIEQKNIKNKKHKDTGKHCYKNA